MAKISFKFQISIKKSEVILSGDHQDVTAFL